MVHHLTGWDSPGHIQRLYFGQPGTQVKKLLSQKEERIDIVWTISLCHSWGPIISNQDNSHKSYGYIVGILSMTVFFKKGARETLRHQIIVVLMFWKSHTTMTHI